LVLCFVLLYACSSTKSVPKGDALYTGAKVTFRDNILSRKKKKALGTQLEDLTRPKPNSKFLGMPIKLFIYNANYKAKKWPGKWLRERFGQPPVLLSTVNLNTNVQVLNSYLTNKGYFNARVKGDTTVKGKKASAEYTVRTGNQYLIQQVQFKGDSSVVQQAVRETMPQTLLKKDDPFDLAVITAERQRIDNHLKENGFYFFSPDFLLIKADTTVGGNKVDLFMTVKPEIPDAAQKVYRINDVWIFTGYNLEPGEMDTSKAGAELYKGYYVVDKRHYYKPKLFQQSMAFDSGDVYNRTDQNASISRLISMDIFKFVKNRFEVVNSDSALLNTYYYLTRMPKKSLRLEVNGSTKSNNLTGSNITLGWRNRNAMRGGEIFSVKASAGFEVQYSGQFKGYNTFRWGLEPSLSFPRFLVPFVNFNTKGGFLPRTTIKLGYDILEKQKLYTMNSFRASYGYTWKESIEKEHELNPIAINYVQPINITPEYLDSAKRNPSLYQSIDTQFILGSNYSYTYTNVLNYKPVNGFYLNAGIDLSGNIAGLITGANIAKGDTAKIFGKQFSQYTRLQADYRYYRKVGMNSVWANRIFAGIGIPYGNSRSLPYVKQFFSGGNNSLRAFRSRTVGPGTYQAPQQNGSFAEQPGDIKFEFNTELRFPLAPSILQGAVFVDAGNVWLWNDDPNKPGAMFSNKFLSELAAGSGVGIRFDLSFLILRFDLAFPIRKPWLDPGKRWVLNQIKFNDPEWRKENLILNLAIGYPF
jgi:outer membrane protein assembly factor BamA